MKAGTRIAGRYRVVRLLGRGGMGEVHEVVDEQLERARAIKVMHAHAADRPDARARFDLEARVGGRVGSPLLVEVIDTGVDADTDRLYLVMELLVGENLGERLARLGPRPPDEVVAHLGQLALALAQMHKSGVVHRDLKPTNLFLQAREGEDARLKVLDLGIAKVMTEAGGESTSVAGTPEYMAPEQLRGRVGPATDIHALGQIAFTLLVGTAYWSEARTFDPIAFGLLAVQGTREPASQRAPGAALPPAFDAWFARATAVEPRRRFPGATAAVRALAEALAVPVPPWLPAVDEPASAAANEPPAEDARIDTSMSTESATAAREIGEASTALLETAPIVPAPRRGRRLAISATGAAGTAAIAAWALAARSCAPGAVLANPKAIVGCPILAVDDAASDGWLGAAAAGLACERARVILGGRPERTRLPAELLDLPGEPTDGFIADPYAGKEARGHSLDAARQRTTAYFDGAVHFNEGKFKVELVLMRADGRELARHGGESVALVGAVRDAMDPLIESGALPLAAAPDPVVADYSQAKDVATMLDLLDLALALDNNAGQLGETCKAFALRHAGSEVRIQFARRECAYTLGVTLPPVALGGASATVGEATTRARVAHSVFDSEPPEVIAAAEQAYQQTTDGWARSALASTLSCLYQHTDLAVATTRALQAVQNEPKNPTGEWCAPWAQLATVARGTASSGITLRAMQAWQPWHSHAWSLATSDLPPETALDYAYRAYRLAPFDTIVASAYADQLLRAGRTNDVRSIVARLLTSSYPTHQIGADGLQVRLDASEARFDQAVARAVDAMRPRPVDNGWVRTERLELGWQAIQIALVLGTEHQTADAAIEALIDPDPPAIDRAYVDTPTWLPAICAYASPAAAERCFARIPTLLPELSGAKASAQQAFTDGAHHFARHEYKEAAESWRPLLRDADYQISVMAEAMVQVFAKAGEPDVVALIVKKAAGRELNGVNMVTVRAAQAAAARKDRDEARRLAQSVVAAWSVASVHVPVLDEMRRLAE